MIRYMFDKVFYEYALTLKDQYETYSELFTIELRGYFSRSPEEEHDAWFVYDKGRYFLLFLKKEINFVNESLRLIKKDQDFLTRNIIPINYDQITLSLIKGVGIKYHHDSEFSQQILVHQDDSNFIGKYLIPDLTQSQIDQKFWLDQMENRIEAKHLRTNRFRFYLGNKQDKTFLNQYVAADIVNDLRINFYIGTNGDIVIPQEKYGLLKRKLYSRNKNLFLFQDPISVFHLIH